MATTEDLRARGFERSEVEAVRLGIEHPDPTGLGPFCRLRLTTSAPVSPGAYAWVVGEGVQYIGRASGLLHVVNGARLGRAYNDYTYVPASKVISLPFSPRVRVNGLLNRELKDGHTVTWWWVATNDVEDSKDLESRLIHQWGLPIWNRQLPVLR